MGSEMARTLHIIIFKDGDHFVASGVELDVFAQGKTKEEAAHRLETVLNAEMEEARASGRDLFDLGAAPEAVQSLFREASSEILAQEQRLVA